VAHAVVEVTLRLNGYRINASVDEQESVMLSLASGNLTRRQFAEWVEQHVQRVGA
jgi:death-on-curing protein